MESALWVKKSPAIHRNCYPVALGSRTPYPIHLSPVLHSRLAGSWKRMTTICHSKLRVVCVFGNKGGNDKDAALRALQNALEGKKDEFNRWDKEIKKREERELAGGRGGNGGRGWFGNGGWFSDFGNEDYRKEMQQAIYAVSGLVLMYLLLVKGEAIISVALNCMVFLLRAPREVLRSITSGEFKLTSTPSSGNESSLKHVDAAHGSAQANVIRKWGPD